MKERRAGVFLSHLSIMDRLRLLFTGRVIVYVFGVKERAECQVATRLPRDRAEAARVISAMKAARDEAKRARRGVVGATGGELPPEAKASHEAGGGKGRLGTVAPEGGKRGRLSLPRLPEVAHGTQQGGGAGAGPRGLDEPPAGPMIAAPPFLVALVLAAILAIAHGCVGGTL